MSGDDIDPVTMMSKLRRTVTISASAALSAVLGSIHAFSVFVPEWESLQGADRAGVSFVYSIALATLTVGVLVGYRVYERLSPVAIFMVVGLVAATGLVLAAHALSLETLYLAYGVVFGGANGLGYGYVLQLSGQAAPSRRGLAMGLVTAFYAVGATASPPVFALLIERGGNALALTVASVIVSVVSLTAAALLRWTGARYACEPASTSRALPPRLAHARALLWIGYGSAVAAGLMIIGHAYGIAVWRGFGSGWAAWAVTIVAFGNMLGGFSAGYCADRLSSRALLRWLPVLTSLGLLILFWSPENALTAVFVGLAIVGYCYGAIIAVYPVAIADVFGALAAPRVYGQVFTAWGLAGLLGPSISGWLFDRTGSYRAALVIAALLGGLSVVAVRHGLPDDRGRVRA